MSELEGVPLSWRPEDGEQPELFLWRLPNQGREPVLLLHGMSARHETFEIPAPDPERPDAPRCLLDWLHARRFEPWLLDWRGSGSVVDASRGASAALLQTFDLDHVARFDIPAALRAIAERSGAPCKRAVAHCMGAASLAQAIAAGHARGLERIALLTIGLFYEPAWDGRLKTQDHALERAVLDEPDKRVVDPRPGSDWPKELEEVYDNWPDALRPHPRPRNDTEEVCNRLSFMYGPIYLEHNLAPEIHAQELLPEQFGPVPIPMYAQAARNARRGWAALADGEPDDVALIGPAARGHFAALEAVTLITGLENQVWHRDSVDRMYEWLRRGPARRPAVRKQILPGYAHQDLLWGARAHAQVFPLIEAALR